MLSGRKSAILSCMLVAVAFPAAAEQAAVSPGAQAQIALSDQLIALGRERKDAILIIAGAHLRDNLTNDPIVALVDLPEKGALLDEAKSYAAGNDDIIEIVEDIRAGNSRGCYNWTGGTGSFNCPIGSQFSR